MLARAGSFLSSLNPLSISSNPSSQLQQQPMSSLRVIILMGPPGSGKGTVGSSLGSSLGLVHLSTGDIFRAAVAEGTDLGLSADSYIRAGHFVPDYMVIELVKERLASPAVVAKGGIILDGFPRTENQAKALMNAGIRVERLIMLQVPVKTCVNRVLHRRVDPVTGAIFNLQTQPPPADVADRLLRRGYDVDQAIIESRINTYYQHLGSILQHFRGLLQVVNGYGDPSAVLLASQRACSVPPPPEASAPGSASAGPSGGGETSAATAAVPAPPPPPLPPTFLCTVCFEEPASCAAVPCGHQCACRSCLDTVMSGNAKCPICRTKIDRVITVFQAGYETPSATGGGASTTASTTTTTTTTQRTDVAQALLDELLSPLLLSESAAAVDDGGWGAEDELWCPEVEAAAAAGSRQVKLRIDPTTNIMGGEDEIVNIAVQIDLPETARFPIDVCCVIDVSGSMADIATYEDENGKEKHDGLSLLDTVIHATKVVMSMLNEKDRLTIVSFEDESKIVFALGEMTPGGRSQAVAALENLRADGGTNIWGGVAKGMDALRTSTDQLQTHRKKTLLVLTDGQPSINPPKGYVPEFRRYKESYPGFTCQVNTFGFGYNVDSNLLLTLANEGNGTCSFIPDARILGTCFVNSVANASSTYTQMGTLHLMPKNGATFVDKVLGDLPTLDTTWGKAVTLGPLLAGGSRDVVVPLKMSASQVKDGEYLEAVLVWKNGDSEERSSQVGSAKSFTARSIGAQVRSESVSAAIKMVADADVGRGPVANKLMLEVIGKATEASATAEALSGHPDPFIVGMLQDLTGRMSKSMTTQTRYKKWGRHYLRAVTRAHQLQLCTNYMDPGIQIYGGDTFKALAEEGGKAFLALPAPKPRPRLRGASVVAGAAASSAGARPASPSMQTYYAGSGGGCFGPESSVIVQDSKGEATPIPIMLLVKGARVKTAAGWTKVVCVAEMHGTYMLHKFESGLAITGGHPIRVNGMWKKPKDLQCVEVIQSDVVFNVVLETDHVMLVDGVECITWGHGLQEAAIKHHLYGTNAIIEKLRSLPGFEHGKVVIRSAVVEAVESWIKEGFKSAQLLATAA